MVLSTLTRVITVTLLALVMAACAGTDKREATGEFFDDSVVTTKVKAALLKDPVVSGLAVNVETFKGTVQLSGFVKTTAERNRAVEVTRDVPGVKQVRNDILIR